MKQYPVCLRGVWYGGNPVRTLSITKAGLQGIRPVIFSCRADYKVFESLATNAVKSVEKSYIRKGFIAVMYKYSFIHRF